MSKYFRCLLLLPFMVSSAVHAGAYIFAGEANGIDVITHPSTYFGNGGEIIVRVCIDPVSPNASDMEFSVQNIVDTYNQFTPTLDNVKLGGNNDVPSSAIDFESVALHEVGHCLGMAHINAASESGLSGNDANYTKATDGADNIFNVDDGPDNVIGSSDDIRGDDVNLVWFRKSNNDPFTIDASVVDSTTYSRDLIDLPAGHSFAVNADRAVSTLLGYVQTEAVMQQGSFFDEAQRTLGHDDVATLRYAQSGLNERVTGAPDNYTVRLEYGGISTSNCDISMAFTGTTGLAFCATGGTFMSATHTRITTASIEFGQGFNWHFNTSNTAAPVLNAIGNLSLTEGDNQMVVITATDADMDMLSFSSSTLPSYANLIDNGDGTATLNIMPVLGDAGTSTVTITVSDNGVPILTAEETFDINVAALDTDGDGLSDFDEISIYLTSPTDPDSDGDFINDFDEVNNSSDPNDPLSWPNFATGDIAPLGAPDGVINAADYLIAQRIVLGELTATSLELAYGDLYPAGAPDGVIDTSDLILILQLVQ